MPLEGRIGKVKINGYPFQRYYSFTTASTELPEKYIINKNATILFWEDGTKTVVKKAKDDDFNARLGFLTAYFQKHCGLSKNQANKFLANLLNDSALNSSGELEVKVPEKKRDKYFSKYKKYAEGIEEV